MGRVCRVWASTLLVFTAVLGLAAEAEAGFKTNVGGVVVSYAGSGDGLAFFDEEDGTLTVGVSGGVGSLSITVTPTAFAAWGNFVGIFIVADDATFKTIKVKGHALCTPYVVGQVWYVGKFTLIKGAVGDTTFYGQDFGLGMASNLIPDKITLTDSWATAEVLGFPHAMAAATQGRYAAPSRAVRPDAAGPLLRKPSQSGLCTPAKAARVLQRGLLAL